MERVTTQKPAQRERASAGESVLLDRLARVDRAGRLESAGAGQERRDETLVEVEQRGQRRARARSPPRKPRQRSCHGAPIVLRELRERRAGRRGPGVDHDRRGRPREEVPRAAKDLPQAAPDAVARDGGPDPARHRDPEARVGRPRRRRGGRPGRVARKRAPRRRSTLRIPCVCGGGRLARRSRRRPGPSSHRESFAPLAPARREDGTPGPRPHPDEEPVGALAAPIVGLIGALHKEGEC